MRRRRPPGYGEAGLHTAHLTEPHYGFVGWVLRKFQTGRQVCNSNSERTLTPVILRNVLKMKVVVVTAVGVPHAAIRRSPRPFWPFSVILSKRPP